LDEQNIQNSKAYKISIQKAGFELLGKIKRSVDIAQDKLDICFAIKPQGNLKEKNYGRDRSKRNVGSWPFKYFEQFNF
jgi:hypothetical protein